MERTSSGRWEQLREQLVNTPELQQQYERTKHSILLSRQLLLQIDAARERAGLSKAELARRIGTSPSVVRRLFSSGSSNPTLQTMLDILDALGFQFELKPVQVEKPSASMLAPRKRRPRAEKGAAA